MALSCLCACCQEGLECQQRVVVWSLWENSHRFSEVGDWKQVCYVRDLKTSRPGKQPKRTAEAGVEQKEDQINKETYQKITGKAK